MLHMSKQLLATPLCFLHALLYPLSLALGLGLHTVPSVAGWTPDRTTHWPQERDFQFLPEYCAIKAHGGPHDRAQYWIAVGGSSFYDHAHHYCAGLNAMRLARQSRSDPNHQKYLYRTALSEFTYMFQHTARQSFMLAEVYYQGGLAEKSLGNRMQAIVNFDKSTELNPKYIPSYAEKAEMYASLKTKEQMKRALVIVTEGLRHNPDSKSLRRKYFEYGGKEPLPEPYPVAKSHPPENTQANAPAKESPTTVQSEMAPNAVSPKPAVPHDTKPGESTTSESTTGNPRSPWCRFCP